MSDSHFPLDGYEHRPPRSTFPVVRQNIHAEEVSSALASPGPLFSAIGLERPLRELPCLRLVSGPTPLFESNLLSLTHGA